MASRFLVLAALIAVPLTVTAQAQNATRANVILQLERKHTLALVPAVNKYRAKYWDFRKDDFNGVEARTKARLKLFQQARNNHAPQAEQDRLEADYWRAKRQELVHELSTFEGRHALSFESMKDDFLVGVYEHAAYIIDNIDWKEVFKSVFECISELKGDKCKDLQGMMQAFVLQAIEATWKKSFVDKVVKVYGATPRIAEALWGNLVMPKLKETPVQKLVNKGVDTLNEKGEEKLAEYFKKTIATNIKPEDLLGKTGKEIKDYVGEQTKKQAEDRAKQLFATPKFASDLFWKYVQILAGEDLVAEHAATLTTRLKMCREAAGSNEPTRIEYYYFNHEKLKARLKELHGATEDHDVVVKIPGWTDHARDGKDSEVAVLLNNTVRAERKKWPENRAFDLAPYRDLFEEARADFQGGKLYHATYAGSLARIRFEVGEAWEYWLAVHSEPSSKEEEELVKRNYRAFAAFQEQITEEDDALNKRYGALSEEVLALDSEKDKSIDQIRARATALPDVPQLLADLADFAANGDRAGFDRVKHEIVATIGAIANLQQEKEQVLRRAAKEFKVIATTTRNLPFFWKEGDMHPIQCASVVYCDGPMAMSFKEHLANQPAVGYADMPIEALQAIERYQSVLEEAIVQQLAGLTQPSNSEAMDAQAARKALAGLSGTIYARQVKGNLEELYARKALTAEFIAATLAKLKAVLKTPSRSEIDKTYLTRLAQAEHDLQFRRITVDAFEREWRAAARAFEDSLTVLSYADGLAADLGTLLRSRNATEMRRYLDHAGLVVPGKEFQALGSKVRSETAEAQDVLQNFKSWISTKGISPDDIRPIWAPGETGMRVRLFERLYGAPKGSNCRGGSAINSALVAFSMRGGVKLDTGAAAVVGEGSPVAAIGARLAQAWRSNEPKVTALCERVGQLATLLNRLEQAPDPAAAAEADRLYRQLSLPQGLACYDPGGSGDQTAPTHLKIPCDLTGVTGRYTAHVNSPPTGGETPPIKPASLRLTLNRAPGTEGTPVQIRITDLKGRIIAQGVGPHRLPPGAYIVNTFAQYLETDPSSQHILLAAGDRKTIAVSIWRDEEEEDDVVAPPRPDRPGFASAVVALCASDQDFVRSVYRTIPERDPADGEIQSLVQRLQSGALRGEVVRDFLLAKTNQGAAFMTDAIQAIYGRQPSSAELAAWPRTRRATIIARMLSDAEHKQRTQTCAKLWHKTADAGKTTDDGVKDVNTGHGMTVAEAERAAIAAYNALTELMAADRGDTAEGHDAYQAYKAAKDRYEAVLAGKTVMPPDEPPSGSDTRISVPDVIFPNRGGGPNGITLDFETGDLSGWTATGDAFAFQPTLGDNPSARHRGQPSGHAGNYWIGGFEKYRGRPGEKPGTVQGDGPTGTLTSGPFTVSASSLDFLVGGGAGPDTRIDLIVDGQAVLSAHGKNTETMRRVTWDLTPWQGKTGWIRIVDKATGGWGHINADDFRFVSGSEKPGTKANGAGTPAGGTTAGGTANVTPPPAQGMIAIAPVADAGVYAYSYRGWNAANWGKDNKLGAGWTPTGGEKRVFIRFDLSAVDLTGTSTATLRLYHYHSAGSGQMPLGVFRLTEAWDEGRGFYKPASAALPGEITWLHQPRFDPRAVTSFSPGPAAGKWIAVDITPLVKAWAAGMPNHGLMIGPLTRPRRGAPESQYGFYSREHGDAALSPRLVLGSGAADGMNILRPGGPATDGGPETGGHILEPGGPATTSGPGTGTSILEPGGPLATPGVTITRNVPTPQGAQQSDDGAPGADALLGQGNAILGQAYSIQDRGERQRAFAQAIALLEKAAELGSAEALYNIGYLYETGNGVQQDNAIAASHYEEAARTGYAEAYNALILVQNQLRNHAAAALTFFRYFKAFPQPALQGFDDHAYSPQVLRAIQSALKRSGYYKGAIDGIIGPGTRAAIQAYVADKIPDTTIDPTAPESSADRRADDTAAGAYHQPAKGTAERQSIMDAARVPISAELGQRVVFVVDALRSDGRWAYMEATPKQPNGAPINWSATELASAWREGLMTDTVMVLLQNRNGKWAVADYVIGPTDVYWYNWVDRYGLPKQLFFPG